MMAMVLEPSAAICIQTECQKNDQFSNGAENNQMKIKSALKCHLDVKKTWHIVVEVVVLLYCAVF